MKRITLETGRFYDFRQVLEITVSDCGTHATMDDASRGMTGMRIDFSALRQRMLAADIASDDQVAGWCWKAYDEGKYSWH